MIEAKEGAPALEHCLKVAEGRHWSADGGEKDFSGRGSALDVRVRVFADRETVVAAAAPHEEEVAAVLEGSFRIEADGEVYDLAAGEGIMIPPDTARSWLCTSPRGVLYRVLTLAQPAAGG